MKKLLLVTGVAVASAGTQSPVLAQGPALEEVIVTAARKEQSLLSLPISSSLQ